ncbi:MAG: hypothetical protein CFH01_00593 [Alphaproteobacteria bacterium MarineAlpha2_Bin1]|nr:MAG: hypothetical protein CFH01_00593 [Alphaproteobacteria bacterium MarineAlpha2_Bin1]
MIEYSKYNIDSSEDFWNIFLQKCLDQDGAETALSVVTDAIIKILGDKSAHLKPGGLKNGETQYIVSAAVMISREKNLNVFFAQQNFPEHQFRLKIPIDHGHPGRVVKNEKPLLLSNTDDHQDFKQILDTSRMGSSIYYPFFWKGHMLGQLICGSQARNTYRNLDLELIKPFAKIASLLWVSHNGSDLLSIE